MTTFNEALNMIEARLPQCPKAALTVMCCKCGRFLTMTLEEMRSRGGWENVHCGPSQKCEQVSEWRYVSPCFFCARMLATPEPLTSMNFICTSGVPRRNVCSAFDTASRTVSSVAIVKTSSRSQVAKITPSKPVKTETPAKPLAKKTPIRRRTDDEKQLVDKKPLTVSKEASAKEPTVYSSKEKELKSAPTEHSSDEESIPKGMKRKRPLMECDECGRWRRVDSENCCSFTCKSVGRRCDDSESQCSVDDELIL